MRRRGAAPDYERLSVERLASFGKNQAYQKKNWANILFMTSL